MQVQLLQAIPFRWTNMLLHLDANMLHLADLMEFDRITKEFFLLKFAERRIRITGLLENVVRSPEYYNLVIDQGFEHSNREIFQRIQN